MGRAAICDGTKGKAMSTESSGGFPWAGADPAWLRSWWNAFLPAPQSLTQPILPGWTFGPVVTINGANSSAPQTEAEIVQRHSYGRQLGRIADALEALIEERADTAPNDARLTAFTTMKDEIDRIKLGAAAERVDQLRGDLAALKAARPEEYRRLRDALRPMLDES